VSTWSLRGLSNRDVEQTMVEMQLGFLVMAISDGSCLAVLVAASCEVKGLPTDTSVSPPCVAAAGTAWAATIAASRLATSKVDRIVLRMDPPARAAGLWTVDVTVAGAPDLPP
jgi:hypothetical protein